ncbi:MAG TPA: hypothetical protein VGG51_08295 [Candidatus Cybelea sp.]|jgi:hypothetical protein
MIAVETAIRAWVEPKTHQRKTKSRRITFRPQPYGERVLVFDTETTTDHAQRLLFGFFRLYQDDWLIREGLIVADVLAHDDMEAMNVYGAKSDVHIYSREVFVEEVFYPEVYVRGTLCVGFNLPFDLARIAVHAGCGRGKNRRRFRLVLSRRLRWPDLRIESASGRAAFIEFVPKRKLDPWELPFFKGRFLDLSTLTRAFTGFHHSLKSACKAFHTHSRKMDIDELGQVNRRTLLYGRQDVRVTWALYRKLRNEYGQHPFATFENERGKLKHVAYMGELYSSASIAKQYLRLLGFRPLLEAQPDFDPEHLGHGSASYFGGRAEVRVRRSEVPVTILDFTSMYASIFILQDLESLISGRIAAVEVPASEIEQLLNEMTAAHLFDKAVWRLFNCLVLVEPGSAILPVRMRLARNEPYTIAVTPFQAPEGRWCTLADVIGSKLLGGRLPKILRAFRFIMQDKARKPKAVLFRGQVSLGECGPIFKTIVEERQRAKRTAKTHGELRALELGLKQMAASGAYGIFAEVNVTPHNLGDPLAGMIYSDMTYLCPDVHNERPGAFANPIIASLVTGGARLMLALLEQEVAAGNGVFAFCDTDSLGIVCGEECPSNVASLQRPSIGEIVMRFDALNPYNPDTVPHLLKVEYEETLDLRCFAISAKRYVLFRVRPGGRIEIIKASESGLGAIIGRSREETTKKLARRVWLSILLHELPGISPRQQRRALPLIAFDVPLRRKFPVSQPSVLKRFESYNRGRSYDSRVKPFGFVQSVTPAFLTSSHDVLPIAPFERELAKSRNVPWVDFRTSRKLVLDWSGEHHAGTIPVLRMDEYIREYRCHPEGKAADLNGNRAGSDARGVLRRLSVSSVYLARIGKEVDRLDEDEGASLDGAEPQEYLGAVRQDLASDIAFLAGFPQELTAVDIGLSPRRWREIVKGRARPRTCNARSIARVAAQYRSVR